MHAEQPLGHSDNAHPLQIARGRVRLCDLDASALQQHVHSRGTEFPQTGIRHVQDMRALRMRAKRVRRLNPLPHAGKQAVARCIRRHRRIVFALAKEIREIGLILEPCKAGSNGLAPNAICTNGFGANLIGARCASLGGGHSMNPLSEMRGNGVATRSQHGRAASERAFFDDFINETGRERLVGGKPVVCAVEPTRDDRVSLSGARIGGAHAASHLVEHVGALTQRTGIARC
ncbi:hypothetical protein D3C86_1217160 [compost metagenome]